MYGETIILSQNFDAIPTGLSLTTVGQFVTINGTNVDVVGNFPPPGLVPSLCAAPESGNCVDMGGTGGNPFGQLELATPLTLTAGLYHLSFDLDGSGRGVNTSTTVDFGPFSQTYLLASGDDTSGIVNVEVLIAGGPTQLEFISNAVPGGDPQIGALLDNVSVSAVPEPGTLALMTTGLLGCAGAIRRRFAPKA
jgi:hypothetical protein